MIETIIVNRPSGKKRLVRYHCSKCGKLRQVTPIMFKRNGALPHPKCEALKGKDLPLSTLQICLHCNKEQDLTNFRYTSSDDTWERRCLSCEKIRIRNSHLKRNFNMTHSDYLKLLYSQGGACAICKAPGHYRGEHIPIDHCHITGEVRGLLCDRCNQGIGKFKDSSELLTAAIKYLEKPPWKKLQG